MQKISELLNITITEGDPLRIYHLVFKDKIIYWEDSNGFWGKREYDSNNNLIYFENSSGFWIKKEFDSKSNLIYFENSSGFWIKREYDDNNNQIYLEDSKGTIIDNRIQTELTLEQIANKFGISVNQLKIKK